MAFAYKEPTVPTSGTWSVSGLGGETGLEKAVAAAAWGTCRCLSRFPMKLDCSVSQLHVESGSAGAGAGQAGRGQGQGRLWFTGASHSSGAAHGTRCHNFQTQLQLSSWDRF